MTRTARTAKRPALPSSATSPPQQGRLAWPLERVAGTCIVIAGTLDGWLHWLQHSTRATTWQAVNLGLHLRAPAFLFTAWAEQQASSNSPACKANAHAPVPVPHVTAPACTHAPHTPRTHKPASACNCHTCSAAPPPPHLPTSALHLSACCMGTTPGSNPTCADAYWHHLLTSSCALNTPHPAAPTGGLRGC